VVVVNFDDLTPHSGRNFSKLALLVDCRLIERGYRQAREWRSQLVEFVGAVVSLSDPAAAHVAGLVRGTATAERTEIRHRRYVFRRARSAVPDLPPAPAAAVSRSPHVLIRIQNSR